MSLPHNLTDTDLARLQTLITQHNVAEFWRVLGTEYHDTYADNAYAVIARPNTPFGEFFGTLVEQHWSNTNPPEANAYQDHFAARVGCADEGSASFAIDALRASAHPTRFENKKAHAPCNPTRTVRFVPHRTLRHCQITAPYRVIRRQQ